MQPLPASFVWRARWAAFTRFSSRNGMHNQAEKGGSQARAGCAFSCPLGCRFADFRDLGFARESPELYVCPEQQLACRRRVSLSGTDTLVQHPLGKPRSAPFRSGAGCARGLTAALMRAEMWLATSC
jgi:hypothetical protein